MEKNDALALIKTHNESVEGFAAFCKSVDEVCGGIPADKFFRVFSAVPPFSRHAAELTHQARAAGINAKYNAQDGHITVYEGEVERVHNETESDVNDNR